MCVFETCASASVNGCVCVDMHVCICACVLVCLWVCLCHSPQRPERDVQSETTGISEQSCHGLHLRYHGDQRLYQLLRIKEDRLLPLAPGQTALLTHTHGHTHTHTYRHTQAPMPDHTHSLVHAFSHVDTNTKTTTSTHTQTRAHKILIRKITTKYQVTQPFIFFRIIPSFD